MREDFSILLWDSGIFSGAWSSFKRSQPHLSINQEPASNKFRVDLWNLKHSHGSGSIQVLVVVPPLSKGIVCIRESWESSYTLCTSSVSSFFFGDIDFHNLPPRTLIHFLNGCCSELRGKLITAVDHGRRTSLILIDGAPHFLDGSQGQEYQSINAGPSICSKKSQKVMKKT